MDVWFAVKLGCTQENVPPPPLLNSWSSPYWYEIEVILSHVWATQG